MSLIRKLSGIVGVQASSRLQDVLQTQVGAVWVALCVAALCGQLPNLLQHLQVPYGVLPQELGQFSEPSVPDLEDVFGQACGAASLHFVAHLDRIATEHSKADGAVCVKPNCRQHMPVFAHIFVHVVPLVSLNS